MTLGVHPSRKKAPVRQVVPSFAGGAFFYPAGTRIQEAIYWRRKVLSLNGDERKRDSTHAQGGISMTMPSLRTGWRGY
ncbi:hypothetical protein BCAR13_1060132 [Paraburkholderia caribensis]|nr:hypothetical protein BCAR13_1060132 [Paraburkholderia caribensis]